MKIRRERYQHGSIRKLKRANGFAWEFRYRVSERSGSTCHLNVARSNSLCMRLRKCPLVTGARLPEHSTQFG